MTLEAVRDWEGWEEEEAMTWGVVIEEDHREEDKKRSGV